MLKRLSVRSYATKKMTPTSTSYVLLEANKRSTLSTMSRVALIRGTLGSVNIVDGTEEIVMGRHLANLHTPVDSRSPDGLRSNYC